jgi:hypothetical protein
LTIFFVPFYKLFYANESSFHFFSYFCTIIAAKCPPADLYGLRIAEKMNTVSLNHLWNYLQGLSLTASNQRWLGEKLIEASTATKAKSTTVAVSHRTRSCKRKGLSDEQLAECLAQYAPLTDADFPELSEADYANYSRCNAGRITKGMEKWL